MKGTMTTREIRLATQRDNASSADCVELRRQIKERRAALKIRLEAIPGELRKEPERLVDLNREDEQIEVELGVLYECENALYRLADRAADREADGVAREALKNLPFVLERLQLANVEHQAAHTALEELLATLGGARQRLRGQHQLTKEFGLTQGQYESALTAKCYPPHVCTEGMLAGARRELRQLCAE